MPTYGKAYWQQLRRATFAIIQSIATITCCSPTYFEYIGDDFEADMAKMAADETTQKWWALCNPMQDPVEDHAEGERWKSLKEVFHTD